MIDKLQIGTRLFRDNRSHISEYTIKSVGKKYYTLYESDHKINISNLRFESKIYSQHNFQLYKTEQEILDQKEMVRLFDFIKKEFSYYHVSKTKFTAIQLRKIAEVISESK